MECFSNKDRCGVLALICLKEEMVWTIDKQFWLIVDIVLLLKTVIKLRN